MAKDQYSSFPTQVPNTHENDSSTFTPGQRVVWRYTPRGGYGYTQRVNAEIIRIGPKRIKIKVQRIRPTKQIEEKWVAPEKLEAH